ncbi:MAG TPA: hypothetical protein GX505_02870 [Clostridiales bacterium]|nr:hypothetical protein [Clostridiales bacterium]
MWRKKLMLLALVLLSLCLSYQAVCYSSASVKNLFNVYVSSSENALIAIPKEDIIVNIQTEETENINLLSHNLTIKNNMQSKLTNVQAILKNNPDLLRFYCDEPVLPGQEVKLFLNINKYYDNIGSIVGTEGKPLILIISADWDSGSAKIEKNIRFAIDSRGITYEENPVPTVPDKTSAPKRTAAPSSKPAPTSTPEINTTKPSPVPTAESTLNPKGDSAEPDADPEPAEPNSENSTLPVNNDSSNKQTNDDQSKNEQENKTDVAVPPEEDKDESP